MNQRKNGFTLIELLAVIVILGVIAVITVPIVKNITKDAKMKSFMNSARGIIRAADLYYSRKDMMDEVNGDIILEFPNNASELELNGKLPEEGTMIINEDGEISLAISNGKYCATKGFNDKDVAITEDYVDCKIIIPGVLSSVATIETSEITSVDACATTGICSVGTAFAIRVNQNETYKFFVINDNGTEVTLIMDRNLGKGVEWINASDYEEANADDNTVCDDGACNDEGPITAVKALKSRTGSWTNIPERVYTYSGSGLNGNYNFQETMRARMLTYDDATNELIGCVSDDGGCPEWLYTNMDDGEDGGYWLSSAISSDDFLAYHIDFDGYFGEEFAYIDNQYSIRPIITLTK